MFRSTFPSPYDHVQLTMDAPGPGFELSVNLTEIGKQPLVILEVKFAVGTGYTVMVSGVAVLEPKALVTVRLTM